MILTHKLLDCNEMIVTYKLLNCDEVTVTHKLLDCEWDDCNLQIIGL